MAAITRKKSATQREGAVPAGALPINDPNWQRAFDRRRALQQARIPKRYEGKTLAGFNTKGDKLRKMLVHSAEAYVSAFNFNPEEPPRKGLFMSGCAGCGKSHLAVAILAGVIEKGYSGLYYNSPDLLADIRATFDKGSELNEDEILQDVLTRDLLVFDDLGAERLSDFVLDRFYLIFNERYESCKPVIVTTNLNEAELEERVGSRIMSRIREMCAQFEKFPQEDWRKRDWH